MESRVTPRTPYEIQHFRSTKGICQNKEKRRSIATRSHLILKVFIHKSPKATNNISATLTRMYLNNGLCLSLLAHVKHDNMRKSSKSHNTRNITILLLNIVPAPPVPCNKRPSLNVVCLCVLSRGSGEPYPNPLRKDSGQVDVMTEIDETTVRKTSSSPQRFKDIVIVDLC